VVDAIEWVVPSIELIDSRIKDWKITLPDTIADNASSCGWILGEQRVAIADIDTGDIDATLTRNGEIVAEGNSSAVLGHPLTAVSWLANKVSSFGVRLRKGDVILPGTATRAIDIAAGDHFVAEFAGLGSVTLDFT
jgi:2-keto-4-pentenoate hydratase